MIKPKPGDKVLEVGCGWGGFAEHLAKNYDVKLDCITISKKQLEFAKKRIFNAGLNEKVNIRFLDYRDVKGQYDSIASIEMIEAVGEKYLNKYFSMIKNNLKAGGIGAIQAIIIKDELGSYHQIFFGNGIQHTNKDVEIIRIGKESSTNSKRSSF